MELSNTELNVLLVALDHMEEHLDEVKKELEMTNLGIDVLDRIQALKSLKTKINGIHVNRNQVS